MSEIVMVNVGVDDHDESLRVRVLVEDGLWSTAACRMIRGRCSI